MQSTRMQTLRKRSCHAVRVATLPRGGVAAHSAWQPSLREVLRNAETGAWPYIL